MFFKKKTVPAELVSLELPYFDRGNKKVRIFVPEHKKGEKLPVIYMTDGQSVFDEESNPLGCWHTREAVATEKAASGKSAIIVGIHSDPNPMFRTAELTPASIGKFVPPPIPEGMPPMPPMPPEGMTMPEGMPPMPPMLPQGMTMPEGMPPTPPMPPEGMTPEMMQKMMEDMMKGFSPEGEKFDEFVLKTVMPAVEEKFPVKKGKENTAIIGSSSGGLEVFYTALSHPELFCAVGALSPAFLFYSEEDIKKWTADKLNKKTPFIYLYCGEGEPKEKQMCDTAKPVFDLIKSTLPKNKVKEVIAPDAIHNESAWEPIFKDFLHIFLSR
jgi:Predicted hydrolase of the alpha/beta superfamily